MRGTKAKKMRRYVRVKYGFLADKDLYKQDQRTGAYVLAEQCKKAMYRLIKKAYKRRKQAYV